MAFLDIMTLTEARWPRSATSGFVIFARRGIFEIAGRICGENQLSEIANRAQQGRRDIGHGSCKQPYEPVRVMRISGRNASRHPLSRGGNGTLPGVIFLCIETVSGTVSKFIITNDDVGQIPETIYILLTYRVPQASFRSFQHSQLSASVEALQPRFPSISFANPKSRLLRKHVYGY